jgi:CRISPR-associated endonuclease/helicase Cas3
LAQAALSGSDCAFLGWSKEMSDLSIQDFPAYFRALNGVDPFPWQARLAELVCQGGSWPRFIDLPTGSGKTACIDIAVFHLAHSSNESKRLAPTRMAWVVDRRLIVDEAYERAASIAQKIEAAADGVLKAVADRLRVFADDGRVLIARRLRGGIPREGDWARTPTQPTVLSSTVDQVGSRLLFRGYGVSASMLPVHAGLLGEDALIFLDEVHLSEPFRQTLETIASSERRTGLPWRFVQLTATRKRASGETDSTADTFALGDDDRANPVLRARTSCKKAASLIRKKAMEAGSPAHADAFVSEALRLAMRPDHATRNILIVVNRVALARSIFEALRERLDSEATGTTTLLVGRSRDIDKDVVGREVLARCKSGLGDAARYAGGKPFFVVATQCIEAGADLDFDALVTQIAPLDSLRQRFGRLNRMGRHVEAPAAILAVDKELSASEVDPIYGTKARETWKWLVDLAALEGGTVDFGIDALAPHVESAPDLAAGLRDAPILMPEHIRAFASTNPRPHWSPDVTLYLHGTRESPADVNVIWRADVPEPGIVNLDRAAEIIELMPPRARESVAVPLNVVASWLRSGRSTDVSDVESLATTEAPPHREMPLGRGAWAVRGGDNEVQLVGADSKGRIRPGDTLIVPASYGGCDRYGWDPSAREPVRDVAAAAAQPFAAQRYVLRLHPAIFTQELSEAIESGRRESGDSEATAPGPWQAIADAMVDSQSPRSLIEALVSLEDVLPAPWRSSLEALAETRKGVVVRYPYLEGDDGRGGAVIIAKFGLANASPSSGEELPESSTESDALGSCGCLSGGQSLADHSEDVRAQVRKFVDSLRLSRELRDDLALAAFLHDVGKADRRFQTYLTGGPWGAPEILAKSGQLRTRREDRRVRLASGLPGSWRHEALSVRIARDHPDFGSAKDPELVLWLVGTHHGYGRPLFPHADQRDDETQSFKGFRPCVTDAITLDPSAGPQRTDFAFAVADDSGVTRVDWPTMFQRLQMRYGTWGLALFEAIVRLGDHRASESNVQRVVSSPALRKGNAS